jgi:hypothetical protein
MSTYVVLRWRMTSCVGDYLSHLCYGSSKWPARGRTNLAKRHAPIVASNSPKRNVSSGSETAWGGPVGSWSIIRCSAGNSCMSSRSLYGSPSLPAEGTTLLSRPSSMSSQESTCPLLCPVLSTTKTARYGPHFNTYAVAF